MPHVHAGPERLDGWERQPDRSAVGEQRQVHAAELQMPVARRQPRVALHELEAAVAGVALELDVADAADAHRLQEPQTKPRCLRIRLVGGVARRAETGRELAELVPVEVQERGAALVEVAVVRAEGVLGAGDDLRHQQPDPERCQRRVLAPQLARVTDHDRLRPGTLAREEMPVDRLEDQREADPSGERLELVRVLRQVGERRRHPVLSRQRIRPALVEHGQHDLVVGLDRQVAERLERGAVPCDELEGLVVARQEHALARAHGEPVEHLRLDGWAVHAGVGAHVPGPSGGARRSAQRVDGDAATIQAPRRGDRVRRPAEHDGGRPSRPADSHHTAILSRRTSGPAGPEPSVRLRSAGQSARRSFPWRIE
jgi:hypothetical protein